MAVFQMTKAASELQSAVVLDADWYEMEITEEPQVEPNKKLTELGGEADGAGFNIVLRLACVDPQFHGRSFTKWLSMANPSDANKFTKNGQCYTDWKEMNIRLESAAFQGISANEAKAMLASGREITVEFSVGDRALYYITQKVVLDAMGQPTEEKFNELDPWQLPRPIAR